MEAMIKPPTSKLTAKEQAMLTINAIAPSGKLPLFPSSSSSATSSVVQELDKEKTGASSKESISASKHKFENITNKFKPAKPEISKKPFLKSVTNETTKPIPNTQENLSASEAADGLAENDKPSSNLAKISVKSDSIDKPEFLSTHLKSVSDKRSNANQEAKKVDDSIHSLNNNILEKSDSHKPKYLQSLKPKERSGEKSKPDQDDFPEKPLYSLPKKNNSSKSNPATKPRTVEDNTSVYSLPKKSTFISSKPPIHSSSPEEVPAYSLPSKKIPESSPPALDEAPLYSLSKKKTQSETSSTNLQSHKAVDQGPSMSEFKPADNDEKRPLPIISPKPYTASGYKPDVLGKKSTESVIASGKLNKSPAIISNKPSNAGLRKFQLTNEHNTHNQVSSAINGEVPMPGMASNTMRSNRPSLSKSSSVVFASPSVSSSVRSDISKSSSLNSGIPKSQSLNFVGSSLNASPPKASFLSTRPKPNISAKPSIGSDLSTKTGSFLASRSSTQVNRSPSPVRGGFIQSAMLRRDSTIGGRSDSTDSITEFNSISLVNPIPRSPTRTPSPQRGHSKTKSVGSIDLSPNDSSPSGKNSVFGSRVNLTEVSLPRPDSSDNIKDLKEKSEEEPSRSPRRWSPGRSTWLGNALQKSTSNMSLNRSPTRNTTLLSTSPEVNRASTMVGSNFGRPMSVSRSPTRPMSSLDNHADSATNTTKLPVRPSSSLGRYASVRKPPPVSAKAKPTPNDDVKPAPSTESKLATTTSLSRTKSIKPAIPPKSEKPKLEALEKLRQLRASKSGLAETPKPKPNHRPTIAAKPELKSQNEQKIENVNSDEQEKPQIRYKPTFATRTTFPEVPDALIPRNRPLNPEIQETPAIMKYHPDREDDSLSSTQLPEALSKRAAKSFASNLSAVLQRGKPLNPLEKTNTSLSPGFERMSGIKKAKTFDDNFLRAGAPTKKVENSGPLTHITKGRAKGPKRRLPKTTTEAASAPVSASSSVSNLNSFQSQNTKPSRPLPVPPKPRNVASQLIDL